jgi:HEPN domain-containing protein
MPGPKPLPIFVLAEQFRYAGALAIEIPRLANVLQIPQLGEARALYLPTAYMVNNAFALELYFKCLIRIGRKPYGKEHDLRKLFGLIGRRSQANIKRYWRERAAEHAQISLEKIYSDSGEPVPKVDFTFCLNISRDAFTTMRYLYEGVRPDKGWAGDGIVESARQVILDKYPHWIRMRQVAPSPHFVYNPHS